MILRLICFSVAVLAFVGCSSQPKYMGQKVKAVSSADNSRPVWTFESGWKIEDVRKQYGDDQNDPKFAYLVTNASVKTDQAIAQCYAMAKARASGEVGRQISETVKEAKALTQNSEEAEFMNDIRTQAHNSIVL